MKPLSRLLVACAALLLIVMYFVPLWSISLEAPQYPEGLGMYIYLNTIRGVSENDLTNINGLNHYIGMKRIEPESIAELRYMPWIIGGLIITGLLAAWWGKCRAVLAWVLLFVAIGAVGLTDFYLWEYDYGHNLDPHAAIKIEGMSYQPPLIGSKQLLNFVAESYPSWGGWAAGISIALAVFALWISRREPGCAILPARLKMNNTSASAASIAALSFIALSGTSFLAGCSTKPQAIDFGKEECAHCKMIIADKRFGGELVTTKGKNYKFDAIECLAAFVNEGTVKKEDVHSLWVLDFTAPGEFLEAKKSFFLHSEKVPSPMGLNLSAYPNKTAFTQAQQQNGGDLYYWDSVRLLATKEPVK